ncbi:MAG: carbon-nitrogen hydrolase family protein [Cyclobacteriaceae bacterium]|nr:carbon-nitrogen hydrolase family protein [Cyclobacteriaceae bacterium]
MKAAEKTTTPGYLLLLFVLGFGMFMFTRTGHIVPYFDFAILLAPVIILRFSRIQPLKRGTWLTLLGFLLSMNIALWGLFKFDNETLTVTFGLIRSSLLAVIWFLPFFVDRLIYPKISNQGILPSLIFPVVTTAIFYLSSLEGPFDDGGGTTSTFGFVYRSLVFMQVRSLFGIWGLVFMHSWFVSIVNHFWENQSGWKMIKNPVILYISIMLMLFVYGTIKTSTIWSSKQETVKIAAVVLVPKNKEAVPMSRIFNSKTTSPFGETISRIENLTKAAADAGARIVSFQEFAMVIKQADEPILIEQFQITARANNVFLSITYAFFSKEGKGKNKHLFIDDNGKILLDYTKRYLLGFGPFGETGVFEKGPEVIQSTETPYGKIGIAVCRDMAFSSFIRQAANDQVDIMLAPSYDWPESRSAWYITSAVENGFSLVRPTYNGYSYASDFHGNELAFMHSDQTTSGVMYADVPVKGIRVLYPVVGDCLGYLSLVGMVAIIGLAWARKRKS